MHRLAATVRLDLRLQMRNGFYYAVAFVLACWFVVLTRLPPSTGATCCRPSCSATW